MIVVLARLQWMTLKGRVIRSLRLLRQPKYLVGSIVGFGWIGLWMIRPILNSHNSHISIGAMPLASSGVDFLPAAHRFVALVVTVILPLPWLLPWGRLGLPFRESELTMLLQAPLTRRQVIQYGLLKSEVGVVISAIVLSLVSGGGSFFSRLLAFFGTWMLFEFWHLNGKWRALFNLRQTEIPVARARWRRLLVAIAVLGSWILLVSTLVPLLAQVKTALSGVNAGGAIASLTALRCPPLLVALSTPAWWLTAPMFAGGSGAAFAAAAVPVLLMIVAQREVVLRQTACFEESALEQAKAKETKKSPVPRFAKISSRTRVMHPFELDRHGPPEVALVWKNAMRLSRVPWTKAAIGGSVLLVAAGVLPAVLRFHDAAYGVLAVFGGVLMIVQPIVGGMAWNNDLRTELAHIELVRTWPVSAYRFVLAEVLSPALMSFASSIFGAGVLLTSVFGSRLRQALTGEHTTIVLLPRAGTILGVDGDLAGVLAIASFLPMAAAVSFFSSALQNLAVLLVPAWMAHSADRTRGVAAFGQRMLFSFAFGLSFMLALIPSALLVGAAVLAQGMLGIPWSAWAFPLWGLLGAIPLLVTGWLIVRVAAPLWERLDPSQELLEIGR